MDTRQSHGGLIVEVDKEYEDLLKAERKVKRDKKRNNYRVVSMPCCLTCDNACFGFEGEISCNVLRNERWGVNGVEDLGLCDKYVVRV